MAGEKYLEQHTGVLDHINQIVQGLTKPTTDSRVMRIVYEANTRPQRFSVLDIARATIGEGARPAVGSAIESLWSLDYLTMYPADPQPGSRGRKPTTYLGTETLDQLAAAHNGLHQWMLGRLGLVATRKEILDLFAPTHELSGHEAVEAEIAACRLGEATAVHFGLQAFAAVRGKEILVENWRTEALETRRAEIAAAPSE